MKKILQRSMLCMAMAGMGFASSALAADAILNITGTIKASPCTVNTDDASGNIGVDLGTDIQANSLAEAGSASEWKAFDLKLTNCPATTTTVVAEFTGTAAEETGVTDMYKNTGDASKVQIELQDSATSTRKGNGSTMQAAVSANAATFPLKARAYTVEGSATPGSVVGTVQIGFTYQ